MKNSFLKRSNYFKYLILVFVFGLIVVRLFNIFVYPSFEILSVVLILGVCLIGLILVWIDEVLGRENLEEMHQELKVKQTQLIQSEKLAALGRLAGGVAHELKNPLTGIVGCVELLLRRLEKGKGDCSGCLRTMETVEKEGRRCQALAKNLLQFSRKKKGEMKPVAINQVIEDTFNILTHHLSQPGAPIKTVKNLGESLPRVLADPDQIEQVIMNLVINSRDAMPKGGTITITTTSREGNVRIELSDTGTGIPEEEQSRIFEPLYTTKGEGKGTGLGLSVSRDIVLNHGGEIYLKSKIGEGTIFTIILPCIEEGNAHK
jgi:two-component system NtrC family sensor kinase